MSYVNYSPLKTFNVKFIPNFSSNSSSWYSAYTANVNNNYTDGSPADTGVTLFQLINNQYLINIPTITLYSGNSTNQSFSSSVLTPSNALSVGAGGQFKINKVDIKMNELLSQHLSLTKFGINENRGIIGNTGSTAGLNYNKQTYLTSKASDGFSYSVILDDDSHAIIDADTNTLDLFNFYVDAIPKYRLDVNGALVPSEILQEQIDLNLNTTVMFEVQITGDFIDYKLNNINRNVLDGNSYKVNIVEYLRRVGIYETDAGTKLTPDQIGELSILRKKEDYIRKSATTSVRIRRYYLGTGTLYNADVYSYSGTTFTNIKNLKIKSGIITLTKDDTAGVRCTAFTLIVENPALLPNPLDERLLIVDTELDISAAGINIDLSNAMS